MAKLSGIDVKQADAKKTAKGIASAIPHKIMTAIKIIILESPNKLLQASTILEKLQSRFEIHPQNARPHLNSGINSGTLSWNGDTKVVTYVGGS